MTAGRSPDSPAPGGAEPAGHARRTGSWCAQPTLPPLWMTHPIGWVASAPTWSDATTPAAPAPCSPDSESGWRTNSTAVHPQTLLESIDADVPLMRALEDFLTANKLALPPDRDQRRAAARRQSRIDAVPAPLRPAAAAFAAYLVAGRDRARRTGTQPRGHATLEARLGAVRDFAQFLTCRPRQDRLGHRRGRRRRSIPACPSQPPRSLPGRIASVQPPRSPPPGNAHQPHDRAECTADHGVSRAHPCQPISNVRCSGGGAPTPRCTRTRRSSGWPPCCTAPPPKNCSISPTPTSITMRTASDWVVDPTRRRWTRGRGPRCNAASATVTHWAATTPIC